MMPQGGSAFSGISRKLTFSVTPRVRVIGLTAALTVALWGFLSYLRWFKSGRKKPLPDVVARAVSPAGSSLREGGGGPRRPVSNSFGSADVPGKIPESQSLDAYIHYGMDSLQEAIRQWEQAILLSESKSNRVLNEDELFESLAQVLEKSKGILAEIKAIANKYALELPDSLSASFSTLTPGPGAPAAGSSSGFEHISAYSLGGRRTLSVLSNDSFVSALEDLIPTFEEIDILDREPLNLDFSELLYYHEGMKEAREGNVICRNARSDFLHCCSDEDFLAKLWCIRNALNNILADQTKKFWLMDAGRTLIGDLLKQSNKDPGAFYAAFDKMMGYLENREVFPKVEEELRARKVPCFTFYDVVLDFILMDAFDDLASPPSAVLAVAQNRFLSASFKESTLNTVVWSVLKAKRARLQVADGFISHFYDISEQVSPTMAWGFLGTNEHLREVCYYFKGEIYDFRRSVRRHLADLPNQS